MRGRGVCVAGGMLGRGTCVVGVCMAKEGHVCMAGGTATAADVRILL